MIYAYVMIYFALQKFLFI